jgi:hypothetical protein
MKNGGREAGRGEDIDRYENRRYDSYHENERYDFDEQGDDEHPGGDPPSGGFVPRQPDNLGF